MIEKIWSGESPLWRLLLPLSQLYGTVSGAIRLCYKLKLKRARRAPYRLSWLEISLQAATEKPRSLSGWWNSCNSAVFAWGRIAGIWW